MTYSIKTAGGVMTPLIKATGRAHNPRQVQAVRYIASAAWCVVDRGHVGHRRQRNLERVRAGTRRRAVTITKDKERNRADSRRCGEVHKGRRGGVGGCGEDR